jgi:hypothetical protein
VTLTAIPLHALAKEGAPQQGAAPAPTSAQAKPISMKNLSCQQYLSLPDDIRPMVAAWVHGFYYRESWTDAWMLDLDRARAILAALNDACKESPGASFRYKLSEVVKKSRAKGSN